MFSSTRPGVSSGMPTDQSSDLRAAREENEALRAALRTLSEAVVFRARPGFEPGEGSATNRYFSVVADVRENLVARAGRAGVKIPDDLGLPALSPTKEQEIQRYLEALDLIERAVSLAIEVGVASVEKIKIAACERSASASTRNRSPRCRKASPGFQS